MIAINWFIKVMYIFITTHQQRETLIVLACVQTTCAPALIIGLSSFKRALIIESRTVSVIYVYMEAKC